MSNFKKVQEFHNKFQISVENKPTLPNQDVRDLRIRLLQEEFDEYLNGEKTNDIVEIADALADMLYIIYGTADAYGLPIDEIFDEVHRSNMSKLDENGNPVRREDGKIIKGPLYSPPDIEKILNV